MSNDEKHSVSGSVEEAFKNAVKLVTAAPEPGQPKPKLDLKEKLTFYALYKTAMEGPMPKDVRAKKNPYSKLTNFTQHMKHKAYSMVPEHIDREMAMQKYVSLTKKKMPPGLKAKL